MKSSAHKLGLAGLAGLVMMSLMGCATGYPLYGTPIGADAQGHEIYRYCTNGGQCLKSYYPQMNSFAFYYAIQQKR